MPDAILKERMTMKISSLNEFEKYKQAKLGKKSLTENQKVQALAEILLTAHFYNLECYNNLGLQIETDVRVNPLSNKDVDIQICKNNLKLNIEVKTPEQDFIEEGKFHAKLPHRYPNVERAENNQDIKALADMLKKQSNIETQILKTNDNKLKDYIESGNAKFGERNSDALNVLIIMCTSEQMGDYLLYLLNPHSGLITPNSYDKTLNFSKIDYIAISNAVEGIVRNCEYEFDINNFSNYITLFFSPHKEVLNESDAAKFLWSIMPNNCKQFRDFEINHYVELEQNGIPKDIHYQFIWADYLTKYHPEFALNKPEKKL